MEPDISEFSYGFALTSELIDTFKLKRAGAPEFATQHAEAEKGGGWDMKLPGLPVFLQFKRADRMVRNTAQDSHLFGAPFFRMHLRQRNHSDQHQLMIDLEASGNVVLYAAPRFTTPDELNKAFTTNQVASRSLFVSPSVIGPLKDDEPHWVTFDTTGPAFFCSTPVEIETHTASTIFGEEVPARASKRPERSSEAFFREVSDDLLRIYRERNPQKDINLTRVEAVRERRGAQETAGLIARTLFDCELLVYPRAPLSGDA